MAPAQAARGSPQAVGTAAIFPVWPGPRFLAYTASSSTSWRARGAGDGASRGSKRGGEQRPPRPGTWQPKVYRVSPSKAIQLGAGELLGSHHLPRRFLRAPTRRWKPLFPEEKNDAPAAGGRSAASTDARHGGGAKFGEDHLPQLQGWAANGAANAGLRMPVQGDPAADRNRFRRRPWRVPAGRHCRKLRARRLTARPPGCRMPEGWGARLEERTTAGGRLAALASKGAVLTTDRCHFDVGEQHQDPTGRGGRQRLTAGWLRVMGLRYK